MSLSQFFSFDPEDRLKDWSTPGGILPSNRSWDLSLEGNWKTSQKDGIIENRTHNGVHEISDIDGVQIYHDDKGNLIQDKSGQQYNWDFDNQMSSANVNGVIFSYAYDALGRRVYKEGNGNTTVFVNNSRNQVVSEYENLVDTNSERVFVYATYVDDPILIEEDSSIYYYHSNRQFSVSALTDDNGQIIERYAYDAYGEPLILTDSTIVDQPYIFTGRRLDSETGLMYFRARYFSAELGRFIGRDPLGYVDGMSMYRGYFVVNLTDPSGMAPNKKQAGSWDTVLDYIRKQEKKGMNKDKILEKAKKRFSAGKNRYVETKEHGWVDLRHFFEAANFADDIGSVLTEALGLGLEIQQWLKEGEDDYKSGFSPEDLCSNAAGAEFGDDYLDENTKISEALEKFLKNSQALTAGEGDSSYDSLPEKDPSLPKKRDGKKDPYNRSDSEGDS